MHFSFKGPPNFLAGFSLESTEQKHGSLQRKTKVFNCSRRAPFLEKKSQTHLQFHLMVSKHLCPSFQRFCSDFRQIKTFGDALPSPAPTPQPSSSLLSTIRISSKNQSAPGSVHKLSERRLGVILCPQNKYEETHSSSRDFTKKFSVGFTPTKLCELNHWWTLLLLFATARGPKTLEKMYQQDQRLSGPSSRYKSLIEWLNNSWFTNQFKFP